MHTHNHRLLLLLLISVVSGCAHVAQAPTARIPASQQHPYQQQSAYVPVESRSEALEELLAEDADHPSAMAKPLAKNARLFAGNPAPEQVTGVFSNSDTPTVAQLIRYARTSVDIEIYEMADPDVRAALREVMARNVRVRVVKEPMTIGQKCNPWAQGMAGRVSKGESAKAKSVKANAKPSPILIDCLDQQKLVREVREHGGAFEPFNKEELCGQEEKKGRCYQHGKLVIIDRDRLALVSTGNFNASNLCDLPNDPDTCNRDYSYITRDKGVIDALEEIFEHDLAGRRYDLHAILVRPGVGGKLTASPFSFDPLANFLRSAKERIQIQNQYINPDSGLAEILIAKAKEGTSVEVQLADVCTYGVVKEKKAYQLYLMFAAMEQAGVKIRMFNKTHKISGKPGYLHAKAIVVDNKKAWIGSVNGSPTSLNENREFGLFFTHPVRVRAFSKYLAQDFADNSSQPWRDSLRCHNVGYKSPEATVVDTSEYISYINELKDKLGSDDSSDDEP